jgi:predicted amidohydrolase
MRVAAVQLEVALADVPANLAACESLAGRGARTPQPEVPPLARSTGRRRR